MSRGRRWLLVTGVLGLSLLLVGTGLALLLRGTRVPARTLLVVNLSEELTEEPTLSVLERLLGWRQMTVFDVVRALDAACADARVKAVLIRIADPDIGVARAQELHQAIGRLREAGRKVGVLLESGGTAEYYVSASADEVYVLPGGAINVTGLAAEVPFARGTLDRVGIEPDFEVVGRYKDSPEVYTRRAMSPTMKESFERLLDRLYLGLTDEMAEDRGIPADEFRKIVDTGYLAPEPAAENGLADDTLFSDEARDRLAELAGGDLDDLDLEDYAETLRIGRLRSRPRVALVYATGTIVPGESLDSEWLGRMAGADTLSEIFRDLREDDGIRAVVLRIDSPGGSGVAADRIWREASLTRDKKPLIASMGDYAASGGYYIAMAADEVLAQPATITGSIGVFSGKFALRGLYEWLGLSWGVVQRGRNADLFNDRETWTEEQRRMVRAQLQDFYDRFLDVVAEGRGLERARVAELAEGKVYTGEEAQEVGLVDALGGLHEALEAAREKAGLPAGAPLRVEVYPRRKGLLASLTGTTSLAPSRARHPAAVPRAVREAALLDLIARQRVAAYLPARFRSR